MTTRPPDDLDRRLVLATQAGLPLVSRPYDVLAEQLGISPGEVRARLADMLDNGRIRRIGAVPNHYALGYTANGMSVWDVPDERIVELGEAVGRLPGVTHCYERPGPCPTGPTTSLPWSMARTGRAYWPRWKKSPPCSAAPAGRGTCCSRRRF